MSEKCEKYTTVTIHTLLGFPPSKIRVGGEGESGPTEVGPGPLLTGLNVWLRAQVCGASDHWQVGHPACSRVDTKLALEEIDLQDDQG